MKIDGVVASLRQRVPWPVATRILKELELPRAQGWDKTVERLTSGDYGKSANVSSLAEVLRQHIRYGEKLVRLYDLSRDQHASALESISNAQPPKTIFRDRYPLTLSEDELESAPINPRLIAVESDDSSTSAIFASVRSMQLREPLHTDQIPEEARGILDNYDEVIGIKHIKYEAFDVVSIAKKTPRAFVLIDYPAGMHKDVATAAQNVISQLLTNIINQNIFTRPINLFPLINSMYRARHEGMVVELAFGTTTASLKHEKMRRQLSCLREETYHKGGKAALGTPIEPHRLSIVWTRPIPGGGNSMPELGLHTTTAVAGSQNPLLFEAEIRKCMGGDDFLFVRSRMEQYLPSRRR